MPTRLSIAETAKYLNVSKATVYNYLSQERIKPTEFVRKGNRMQMLFDPKELDQYKRRIRLSRMRREVNHMGQLRIEKGLSRSEASEALGVTWRTLFRYEIGETFPNPTTARKMAKFYGCKLHELFKEKEE